MAKVACLGMAVHDRIMYVPAIPAQPCKVYAGAVAEAGGGPAATAAAAICKLGGDALLLGRVGADGVGDIIRRDLQNEGVDTGGLHSLDGAQSAWSVVLMDPSGERLIINYPGSGLMVTPDWIEEDLRSGCGALLVDMGWPAGAMKAISIASRLGIPSIVDADYSPHEASGELLKVADHVLFSEGGLASRSEGETTEAQLLWMQEKLPRATVGVTVGAKGCLWVRDGDVCLEPGYAVDVVDTLGAGDTFHGAYAIRIAEGASPQKAIRFANAAAALKCQRPGGRKGLVGRPETEQLLASGMASPAASDSH